MRLLRGESLDLLARESGQPAGRIASWREEFLAAGREGLKARPVREEPTSERLGDLARGRRRRRLALRRHKCDRRLGHEPARSEWRRGQVSVARAYDCLAIVAICRAVRTAGGCAAVANMTGWPTPSTSSPEVVSGHG
jgi:hypothetical protein